MPAPGSAPSPGGMGLLRPARSQDRVINAYPDEIDRCLLVESQHSVRGDLFRQEGVEASIIYPVLYGSFYPSKVN